MASADDYGPLYEAAGRQYDVDPRLLRAIVHVESRGRPDAVSEAGARGVAQLMPDTAKALGVADPHDPAQAIPGAAKLIAENLARYGSPDRAILAYHGGTDEKNWGPKTRSYLGKVTAAYGGGVTASGNDTLPGGATDDAFNAAFKPSALTAAPQPRSAEDTAFDAAFKSGPERPTASAKSPPAGRPNVIDIAKQEFSGALGPSERFLDALGLDATGAAGLLRAPVRGALTVGDAALRAGNVLLKGVAAQTYDIGSGVARLTGEDPDTAGNKLVRDVYGMVTQAGINPPAVPRVPAGRTAAAVEGVPPAGPNRLLQSPEAPMVPVGPGAPPAPAAPTGPAPASVNRLTAEAPAVAPPANRLMPEPAPVPSAPATPPRSPATPAERAAAIESGASAPSPAETAAIPDKLPSNPLFPIVTKRGAEKRANKIIEHFAGEGPRDVNLAELVPGSAPTLAQATGNAGIATLERGFRDANPNAFVQRAAANGDARAQTLLGITGTEADIAAAEAVRNAATARLRDAAFAEPKPVMPTPVVAKIDEILAGPEGQRDVVRNALQSIRSKIVVKDAENPGALQMQTDPVQLYGVRKAINDSISPKAAGTAGDARQAARELIEVQRVLDSVIESGAPGFGQYIRAYAEASKPIDAMKFLQGLNLTDARGNITLAKVDNAIKAVDRQTKLPGIRAGDAVAEEQMAALRLLRDDMRREANSSLGKSLGSNTVQNLTTNWLLARLGGAPSHVGVGAALLAEPVTGTALAALNFGGNKLAARGERLVQNALQERLLNPARGAEALQRK